MNVCTHSKIHVMVASSSNVISNAKVVFCFYSYVKFDIVMSLNRT